jgi:ABC-2 type transport system permease protein
MADVAHPIGILTQIRLVAGLRWRILRNSLRKKNTRLDLLGLILLGALSGIFVLGLCFAFSAGAYTFLSGNHPERIAFLFWAILLFWQIFPIFVAGFGASFEFRTLLRFPLSRGAFYLISLAYGLADFSAIASVCWLVSMTLGVAAANLRVLPLMLFIVAAFLLLNVTLERLIGSWLERLLSRRKARELFFALFILSMVSLNFLNPAVNRYGATLRLLAQRFVPYLAWLPPSLAGSAVAAVAEQHVTDVLVGAVGLVLYGAVFTVFLWRRFAAQYRGEELSETAAPTPAVARSPAKKEDASDRLSGLSPQVAAVLRKEFRYLTRNTFTFFTLLMPPILVLIFSSQFAGRHPTVSGQPLSAEMFFPGMMAYLILILMAPAYNCFAYEGRGMQTYFMVPLRFREVFLGKNLMLVLVLAVEIGLSLAMLAWRVGFPSPPMLIGTLSAIVFTVVGQLVIANWSSLNFPRKIEFGQIRGQRQSGMAVLTAFASQILLGGISSVILFSGRWTGNPWLPAEAFTFLAAAAMAGYFASLDALTRLAEAKKEVLLEALCR